MLIKKLKEFCKKALLVKNMDDNKYCRSTVIYNSEDNFILLISFTKEYFLDAIELLDDIHNSNDPLHTKLKSSSYEETVKDSENNDKIIVHNKHYLLIGGSVKNWISLYEASNNLGNEILRIISKDIINNREQSEFESLVNDCVLQEFPYTSDMGNARKRYDKDVELVTSKGVPITYTHGETLMSKIPDSFYSVDLLDFILINYNNETIMSLKQVLIYNNTIKYSEEEFKESMEYLLLKGLFDFMDINYLKLIMGPVYKQPDEDLSTMPGSVDDESLDDIFKENYERFSAVNDDNQIYEDIDELLNTDDTEVDDNE